MKKIVYLVTEDWYFWSHRLALAEVVKQQGFQVFVFTRAGAFAKKIRDNGFVLVPVDIPRSIASPIKDLQSIRELVRQFKQIKPDLVHNIAFKPILSGSIAAWIARVPTVVNSYTGLGNLFISRSFITRIVRSAVLPVLGRLLRTRRYYSIVQNTDDQEQLLRLGLIASNKMVLISGSGVDTEKFGFTEEVSDAPAIVLFASRLLRDKGIHDYINAARIVSKKNSSIRFVVVGDRDEANPTSIREQELSEWVSEGVIEWWGSRDDMANVFSQVNLVCLPSYREGLPKVLLEAASCGRAIVTTDVPGCREVVEDGVNGLLVPLQDPARLAEAILQLVNTPEVRKKMAIAGRERVIKYFDIQRVNKETLNLYNVLVKAQPITPGD